MKNLSIAGRRVPPSEYYPVGTKIGCWVVVENNLQKKSGNRMRPACLVRCRCGGETVCMDTTLRQGKSTRCKSCAWAATHKKKRIYQSSANPMIPVGAKFGRWTVIENGLRIGKIRAVRALCKCKTVRVKTYFSIRRSNSCGCGEDCSRKGKRSLDTTWNAIYGNIIGRGKDCHLTLPQVKAICQLNCAYCGIEPSNVMRMRFGVGTKREHDPKMDVHYSGIDRIDSNVGYIPGNVVPCCARCNIAKNSLGVEDFLAMLSRIRIHNPTVAGIRKLALRLAA